MYLVAIGWMYVVLMMAAAEAMHPQGSLLGAVVTFVLYGVLPLSIVLYVMGAPRRRAARRRAEAEAEAAAEAEAEAEAEAKVEAEAHGQRQGLPGVGTRPQPEEQGPVSALDQGAGSPPPCGR